MTEIEHDVVQDGTLHVKSDGTTDLYYFDRSGTHIGVTGDALVTLNDHDKADSGYWPPAWQGVAARAAADLDPGVYEVSFEVPGERLWNHRRKGLIYGIAVYERRSTRVRLTRANGQSHEGEDFVREVGDEMAFLTVWAKEITAQESFQ